MWFVWVVSGTIFLPGLIGAVCHSCRQVFGDSNEYHQYDDFEDDIDLGIIPAVILRIGIYSIILLLPNVFSYGKASPADIIWGFIIGGFLGLIHTIVSEIVGCFWVDERAVPIAAEIITGMVVGAVNSGFFAGFISFSYRGTGELLPGVIIGTIVGVMTGGIILFIFLVTHIITEIFSSAMAPLLSLLRFKKVLCNNCLRYTHPLCSRYTRGKRYCEHCYEEVEWTKPLGNLIFTFGNFHQRPKSRIFVLSNPDFERKNHAVDVSEVYIDTKTSDTFLLERFMTYIVNYPPLHGVQSVRIFYSGKLDDLGKNLKNALRNNFSHVAQIH